jgi:hypothetical protein
MFTSAVSLLTLRRLASIHIDLCYFARRMPDASAPGARRPVEEPPLQPSGAPRAGRDCRHHAQNGSAVGTSGCRVVMLRGVVVGNLRARHRVPRFIVCGTDHRRAALATTKSRQVIWPTFVVARHPDILAILKPVKRLAFE